MWKIVGLMSLLLNLAFLSWGVFVSISADPELANKQEWSILQSLEAKNRNNVAASDLMIETNYNATGYDAFGILNNKTHQRVWFLGNARNIPLIKILPTIENIHISPEQLDKIKKQTKLNQETLQFISIRRD